jgi:transposase
MHTITTIGLDIAKSVLQVHGVDAQGKVVIRRQLKRRYVLAFFAKLPPCLFGIEACASSHHWSRELKALGHTVRTNVARAGGLSVSVKIHRFSSRARRGAAPVLGG